MEKLKVLIPKEIKENETRVAATPDTVKAMVKQGLQVDVETGAGDNAGISNNDYETAGAKVNKEIQQLYETADIILCVNPPQHHYMTGIHQCDMLKPNAVWISMMIPQSELESIKKLAQKNITCFSMNLVPRISRAQKMDALSSQSNIAGYKAVILGANYLGKIFPLLMTAAGTLQPAKVVVLGAGVAGLQAIATAKRLGAVVEASDVRQAAKEQVESLGAKFIDVPFENAEDKSGYAKEASKEYLQKQKIRFVDKAFSFEILFSTLPFTLYAISSLAACVNPTMTPKSVRKVMYGHLPKSNKSPLKSLIIVSFHP